MSTVVEQRQLRRSEGRLWPVWGIAAVLLVMSRVFVTTPSLTSEQQATVPGALVDTIAGKQLDLYLGNGLSWLGIACLVVFVAGLYRRLSTSEPAGSLIPVVVLSGGTATAGGLLLAYGFLALLAGVAGEDLAPTTVAAIYTIGDSLAYMAWTSMGIVTAGVAIAGIRHRSLPRWLGYVSGIFTLLFVALSFFPFLSWFPALIWLLVTSIGLLVGGRGVVPARSTIPSGALGTVSARD